MTSKEELLSSCLGVPDDEWCDRPGNRGDLWKGKNIMNLRGKDDEFVKKLLQYPDIFDGVHVIDFTSNSRVTEPTFCACLEALVDNQTVFDLEPRQMKNIGERSAFTIAKILPRTRIRTVNMYGVHIGDQAALELMKAVQSVKPMKSLALSRCGLTDRGACEIACVLKQIGPGGLERTSFHDNNLSRRGREALAQALVEIDTKMYCEARDPASVVFKEALNEAKAQVMYQKYMVASGKMLAGGIRVVFEDILSGMWQCIYLAKMWHQVNYGSRAFTMASIFAGVASSIAGPLVECMAIHKLQAAASRKGASEQERQALLGTNAGQSKPQQQSDSSAGVLDDTPGSLEQGIPSRAIPRSRDATETIVKDVSVENFILGSGRNKWRSSFAHRALLAGSALFWCAMGSLPFLGKIECGEPPPSSHTLFFFMVSVFNVLIELWVLVQCRQGYLMFKNLRMKLFFGCALSFVGRFDCFSDVEFAHMLMDCQPITWFSIEGFVVHIPAATLSTYVNITLVVGVYCLQAFPACVLLGCKRLLPVALKLNEFNLLLTVMDDEAKNKEIDSDDEVAQ